MSVFAAVGPRVGDKKVIAENHIHQPASDVLKSHVLLLRQLRRFDGSSVYPSCYMKNFSRHTETNGHVMF
jgi:hypothetical protein